jgi:prepilin-type N-terminal cleavage/methylation domain-containing protein
MSDRHLTAHRGFTVLEVLVAMALITIGLMATVTAFQHGLSAIDSGGSESVATFLVEDKLEELKDLALRDWTSPALAPGMRTEYCRPSESACSTTPGPAALRRTTTVADGGGTCPRPCKVVTVSVFYSPVTSVGQFDQERRVDAHTVFVPRR